MKMFSSLKLLMIKNLALEKLKGRIYVFTFIKSYLDL